MLVALTWHVAADLTATYICTAHAISVNVSNNIAWYATAWKVFAD